MTGKWSLPQRSLLVCQSNSNARDGSQIDTSRTEKEWRLWCLYVGSQVLRDQGCNHFFLLFFSSSIIWPLESCLTSPQRGEWALKSPTRTKGAESCSIKCFKYNKFNLMMVEDKHYKHLKSSWLTLWPRQPAGRCQVQFHWTWRIH